MPPTGRPRPQGQGRRERRESIADARARRAAIDDPEVVLAAGLRFLEARSRSVEEVRRRLTDAGYRADLVAATIDRLASIGLLDDELFARGWIESRDRARPRGEMALRRELSQRGVGRTEISAALDERREPGRRTLPGGSRVGRRRRLPGLARRGRRTPSDRAPAARLRPDRGPPQASRAGLRPPRPERLRPGGLPHGRRLGCAARGSAVG